MPHTARTGTSRRHTLQAAPLAPTGARAPSTQPDAPFPPGIKPTDTSDAVPQRSGQHVHFTRRRPRSAPQWSHGPRSAAAPPCISPTSDPEAEQGRAWLLPGWETRCYRCKLGHTTAPPRGPQNAGSGRGESERASTTLHAEVCGGSGASHALLASLAIRGFRERERELLGWNSGTGTGRGRRGRRGEQRGCWPVPPHTSARASLPR